MAPTAGQTAMKKDPSATLKADAYTRVSRGRWRDPQGNIIKSYGNPATQGAGGNRGGGGNRGSGGGNAASRRRDLVTEGQWRNQPDERRLDEMSMESMYAMNRAGDLAGQFNPYDLYGKAPEQGYVQALEQAQASVMDQFNRQMDPQFARQNQDFQQQMMSQGIDPNSDAYKLQYEAMQRSQNDARLSAQSQAYQLGMESQKQGFGQYMQGLQYPLQAADIMKSGWQVPLTFQQDAQQREKDRQAQLQAQRMSSGASVQAAQIQAQAQRDATNAALIQQYGNPQQGTNYANQFVSNFVGGMGGGIGQRLTR
jgi:hypothetical protein